MLSLAFRWLDRETSWSRLALVLAPFLLWLSVRAPFSPMPWEAWREVEMWIQAAVVLLLASSSRNRDRVGWCVGAAAVLVSAAALWQSFAAPGWLPLGRVQVEQYWGRASGTFGNPNSFALFSVLGAAVLFSFALDSARSGLVRAVAGWSALFTFGAALLSGSRGVAAALTAALLIAALRSRRWRLALGAILVAGAVIALVPPVRERVRLAIEHRGETARAVLWPVTINAALQQPLTGSGGGTFPLVFEENRPARFVDAPLHAHSEPLELWLEHGLIGLLLLLAPVSVFWIRRSGHRVQGSGQSSILPVFQSSSHPIFHTGQTLQPSNPPILQGPPASADDARERADEIGESSHRPGLTGLASPQNLQISNHPSPRQPERSEGLRPQRSCAIPPFPPSPPPTFPPSNLPSAPPSSPPSTPRTFHSSNLPLHIALLTFALACGVDFHLRVPALLFTAAWLFGFAWRAQRLGQGPEARELRGRPVFQPSSLPIFHSGKTLQPSNPPVLQPSQTRKTAYLAFLKQEGSASLLCAAAMTLALVAATPFAVRASFAETSRRAALDSVQGLVGTTPQERERLLTSAASARTRLQHAVRLDPSHARAWADLSAMELLATPPDSSLRPTAGGAAEAAARTALGLSDAPAESWVRLGNALQATGRPDAAAEAAACFQQALRRAPRSPLVWYHYAFFLASRPGSARLALSAIENCLQLDPTHRAAQHLRQRLSSFE